MTHYVESVSYTKVKSGLRGLRYPYVAWSDHDAHTAAIPSAIFASPWRSPPPPRRPSVAFRAPAPPPRIPGRQPDPLEDGPRDGRPLLPRRSLTDPMSRTVILSSSKVGSAAERVVGGRGRRFVEEAFGAEDGIGAPCRDAAPVFFLVVVVPPAGSSSAPLGCVGLVHPVHLVREPRAVAVGFGRPVAHSPERVDEGVHLAHLRLEAQAARLTRRSSSRARGSSSEIFRVGTPTPSRSRRRARRGPRLASILARPDDATRALTVRAPRRRRRRPSARRHGHGLSSSSPANRR